MRSEESLPEAAMTRHHSVPSHMLKSTTHSMNKQAIPGCPRIAVRRERPFVELNRLVGTLLWNVSRQGTLGFAKLQMPPRQVRGELPIGSGQFRFLVLAGRGDMLLPATGIDRKEHSRTGMLPPSCRDICLNSHDRSSFVFAVEDILRCHKYEDSAPIDCRTAASCREVRRSAGMLSSRPG